MRRVLGIAIELFEYNRVWRSVVLFLAFFITASLSFEIISKPNIEKFDFDLTEASKAILDHALTSVKPKEKAKLLLEKATKEYQKIKKDGEHRGQGLILEEYKESSNSEIIQAPIPEPTTLEILNEN